MHFSLAQITNGDPEAFYFLKCWGDFLRAVDDIVDEGKWEAENLFHAFALGNRLVFEQLLSEASRIADGDFDRDGDLGGVMRMGEAAGTLEKTVGGLHAALRCGDAFGRGDDLLKLENGDDVYPGVSVWRLCGSRR
jgi:hypothetical protein